MRNQPGLSWGYEASINLIKHPKGWAAFFCFEDGGREIIKIFKPKNVVDYYEMLSQLSLWNYGTCELCPIVKMEMDYTA